MSELIQQRLLTEQSRSALGREWLQQLPEHIKYVQKEFGLHDLQPFEPGGYQAWTAKAVLNNHTVVIKLYPPDAHSEHEAALLEAAAPGFLPRVYQQKQGVLIMEYIQGIPVHTLGNQDYASLLPSLLADLQGLPQLELPLLESLFEEAGSLYEPVVQPLATLHGDLHEEHLLLSDNKVRALDPKPYVGAREYDIEPLLRRHADRKDVVSADQMLEVLSQSAINMDVLKICATNLCHHYLKKSFQPWRQQLWKDRLAFWQRIL